MISLSHSNDLTFYLIPDWRDQQWDNGAFAGTSYWLALNDYAGIGDGAGETPVFLVLDGAMSISFL